MKWIDRFWDKSFFKFLAYGLGKGHFIKAVSELQREYVAVGRGLTIIKRLRNPGYGVIEAFVLPFALNLPDYEVV